METITKLLVTVLMSNLTSVVFAQTPIIKQAAAKISAEEVLKIRHALNHNNNLWYEDSVLVETLLQKNNIPIEGIIENDEDIISKSKTGDSLLAYISYSYNSYWLTYFISRKNKFIGRMDIKLE